MVLILALVLAGLLAVVLFVLCVPVAVLVRLGWTDALRGEVRVQWLFGLVDIGAFPRERSRRSDSRSVPDAGPDREQGSRPGLDEGAGGGRTEATPSRAGRRAPGESLRRRWRIVRSVVAVDGVAGSLARLGARIVRYVHVDHLQVRAAFGLDDPADTGRLYGVAAPICVGAAVAGWDVACQPLFSGPGLEGMFRMRIRTVPLLLAGAGMRFLLSPPVLRAGWVAWRASR